LFPRFIIFISTACTAYKVLKNGIGLLEVPAVYSGSSRCEPSLKKIVQPAQLVFMWSKSTDFSRSILELLQCELTCY